MSKSSLEMSPLNVSLSSERPPSLHPSVDAMLPQHRHEHTSIFKHAASAWRHDTARSEPKYMKGHLGIASHHIQSYLFHLLAPLILSFLIITKPLTLPQITTLYIQISVLRSFSCLTNVLSCKAGGPWTFRKSEGNISISAC